jgi:hypothetical protein
MWSCVGYDGLNKKENIVSPNIHKEWGRPEILEWNPTNTSLIFQQVDLDHYIAAKPITGMPGAKIGPVPVIRYIAFCITN